jgi:proline iminopeptidase
MVRLLENQQSEIRTGGVKLIQIDGKYNVWTKKIGNSMTKMLTLHGGPGMTHEYLECFEDFLPQAGIEFYYYDQLGSGYSDQPKDKSLWTVNRFREEVEQVRTVLGLENFYLYGHSWGGLLGIEYALKYQQHLKALIISNWTASYASWIGYKNEFRQRFPPEAIEVLEKYEAKGDYAAPEYQAVLENYFGLIVCRVNPLPEPFLRSLGHSNEEVLKAMFGTNSFAVGGTAGGWDRWDDLKDIKVPTLVIGGRFDLARPEDLQKMGGLIPRSRVVICENGSHNSEYDDQETYFRELLKFVKDVETDRFNK